MRGDRSRFRRRLLAWFARNRRDLPWRRTTNPYAIWVSEVMLQQTQVDTVIPYYERFIERFPDIRTLAEADLQDVLKMWEGLGYYARARNLHAAARKLTGGAGSLPGDYQGLRELPGIGDYIGAAVASIAFGEPRAVVDGNVKRVLARLSTIAHPINKPQAARVFRETADALLDSRAPGDFNEAIMELGATVCRPRRPLCGDCPVSEFCEARAAGRLSEFPVREAKKPVPKYHIAVGVVQKGGRVLITQREPDGLLGGLWEFPGGKVAPGESPSEACRREIGEEVSLDVVVGDRLAHVEHAYTHFKIGMDVFACRYRAGTVKLHGPVDYRWIVAEEIDAYPFPGANHKFLPVVKERLKAKR